MPKLKFCTTHHKYHVAKRCPECIQDHRKKPKDCQVHGPYSGKEWEICPQCEKEARKAIEMVDPSFLTTVKNLFRRTNAYSSDKE